MANSHQSTVKQMNNHFDKEIEMIAASVADGFKKQSLKEI